MFPPTCVLNLSPEVLSKSSAWVHQEDCSEAVTAGRMSPLLGLLHGWKPPHAPQELGDKRGHPEVLFTISMSMGPSKMSLSPKIEPAFLHQEPGEIAPEVSTRWCTQVNTHKCTQMHAQTHKHTKMCAQSIDIANSNWEQPLHSHHTSTSTHRAMSNTPGPIPFPTSA